ASPWGKRNSRRDAEGERPAAKPLFKMNHAKTQRRKGAKRERPARSRCFFQRWFTRRHEDAALPGLLRAIFVSSCEALNTKRLRRHALPLGAPWAKLRTGFASSRENPFLLPPRLRVNPPLSSSALPAVSARY